MMTQWYIAYAVWYLASRALLFAYCVEREKAEPGWFAEIGKLGRPFLEGFVWPGFFPGAEAVILLVPALLLTVICVLFALPIMLLLVGILVLAERFGQWAITRAAKDC